MQRGHVLPIICGFLLVVVGTGWAEVFPDRQVLAPYQAAAVSDELWALRYNPAALGLEDDWIFCYAHTYSDSDLAGNDLFFAGARNFAVGIEWLGSGGAPNARRHSLAYGKEIKERIFLGTAYRWVSSDDSAENKAHLWTHSLMLRPNRTLSLAVRLHNANHMRYRGARTSAVYTYSAGLNLGRSKLVLGADFHQCTGQKLADGSFHFSAAWEMVDGLIVFGDYGDHLDRFYRAGIEQSHFGIGVRLNLTQMMISSYNAFNARGKFYRGNLAIGSFKERRRTVVRRRSDVADLRLGGQVTEKEYPSFFFGGAR